MDTFGQRASTPCESRSGAGRLAGDHWSVLMTLMTQVPKTSADVDVDVQLDVLDVSVDRTVVLVRTSKSFHQITSQASFFSSIQSFTMK